VAARGARCRVATARANAERNSGSNLVSIERAAEVELAVTLRDESAVDISATGTERSWSIAERTPFVAERRGCIDSLACRAARDGQSRADGVAEPATYCIPHAIAEPARNRHIDSLAGSIARTAAGPITGILTIEQTRRVEPADSHAPSEPHTGARDCGAVAIELGICRPGRIGSVDVHG
jgi:hypothetical protein